MSSLRIGVLAVQGAFAEHVGRLRRLGCDAVELRQRQDVMRTLDGLVLPGGESTVQAKLLRDLGMMEPLERAIREGLPVLGTCAGLILLAGSVESASDGRADGHAGSSAGGHAGSSTGGLSEVPSPGCAMCVTPVEGFRTLPVAVRRNGYGRQLGSFAARGVLNVAASGRAAETIPLTFIRAPRIVSVGCGVETLVALDGEPVAVRFGRQVGCCFHPELDPDDSLYELAFFQGRSAG